MRFPRLVIPLSVALTALFNLGTNFLAVLAFALASGVEVRWSWLELLPLIVLLATLAVGVGMLLSALYVRFRDIQPIWEVAAQILFYGSPIIYVAATSNKGRAGLEQAAVTFNPIATMLTQMRARVRRPGRIRPPRRPSAAPPGCSSRSRSSAGMFALGLWFFNREAPRIAEHL